MKGLSSPTKPISRPSIRFARFLAAILLAADPALAGELVLTPADPSGIYDLGETVRWTASLTEGGSSAATSYRYEVRQNNFSVIQRGELNLVDGEAVIETSLDEPGMLYVEVTPKLTGGGSDTARGAVVAGAAVAPRELQPVEPRPDDFDEFWQAKIEALREIPPNPVITPKDSGNSAVDYATIMMDHVGGTHVHGQLARPARPGKFPALVILQWAGGPYPLDKSWVLGHAAQGWLTLNIEPHDVLPDQPQSYYDALPPEVKNYHTAGCEDRETCYYLSMYLRDYRAVEYIASRPDWDGETLVVMGTSMGGQQSLCAAGLHPQITHLIVNVPAGCDLNAARHGRQAGYPNFAADNSQAMATARYIDAVNFAPNIQARSLVAMGFVDTVCPPAGIWTAFNQIPAPKEAVPMVDSPHNHQATPEQQRPFTERSAAWLKTLVDGGEVLEEEAKVGPGVTELPIAARPMPRTDENSQEAHRQLLAKARQGQIDLYFLGDSITRRWGCTDPQYADLMASWKQNFFGWNAANFGWGGDRTENILWRIENGELDGVRPKVIVLLAGTNNLTPQHGADGGPDGSEIAAGVQAIVEKCREKAPEAKIIVTGVSPRNDYPDVQPVIERINAKLAELADSQAVRYIDVNDKLADEKGRLRKEMTPDGLHLSAQGYQVWADALRPLLTELLGPRAKVDKAPPPTGDPSLKRKAR